MAQNFNGPVTVNGNEILTKTSSGIAKADLASDVQVSLGKADTAVQPAALNNYYTANQTDSAIAAHHDSTKYEASNPDGFITKAVADLTNYYTKSTTYTKTEVDALVGAIKTIKYEIVTTLPTASAQYEFNSCKTIYLVLEDGKSTYTENICVLVSSTYKWEQIGTTAVDLTGYLPLTAGSSKALTGDLYLLNNRQDKAIYLVNGTGFDSMTALSHTESRQGSYANLTTMSTGWTTKAQLTLTPGERPTWTAITSEGNEESGTLAMTSDVPTILELQGSELPDVGSPMTVTGLDVQAFMDAIDANKTIVFYISSSINDIPLTFTLKSDYAAKVEDYTYVCGASTIYDGNLLKLSVEVEDNNPTIYCTYSAIGQSIDVGNGLKKMGNIISINSDTATAGQVLTANGDGTATFQNAGGGTTLNKYTFTSSQWGNTTSIATTQRIKLYNILSNAKSISNITITGFQTNYVGSALYKANYDGYFIIYGIFTSELPTYSENTYIVSIHGQGASGVTTRPKVTGVNLANNSVAYINQSTSITIGTITITYLNDTEIT